MTGKSGTIRIDMATKRAIAMIPTIAAKLYVKI